MCLDPKDFPRKSGRGACVQYRRESFFRIKKAYNVFKSSIKQLGHTMEERKAKLLEDALKISYKQYDLSPAALDKVWQTGFHLPSFQDVAYETKKSKESFQLTTHYQGRDDKSYPVCGPGFQNKKFGGRFIDGACAYEEWRWDGAPAEAVLTELIKIKALKEAIKLGQGTDYAYELRKVVHRAYILSDVLLYMRLGHHGKAFRQASLQAIQSKLTYSVEGNFGTGAFTHDTRVSYLIQPFAYVCASQIMKVADKARLILYPFDKIGQQGLEDAPKVWAAVQQEVGDNKITFAQFAGLTIKHAQALGKPLAFKRGNGT